MTSRPAPPTEEEFLTRLRRGEVLFPPLTLQSSDTPPKVLDALLRMDWNGKTHRFAVEYKRIASPRILADAATRTKRLARRDRLFPLVIVPYLDEKALDALEEQEVSGIDLCGNGVVLIPGEWYVRRTGATNQFRAEGEIKNVYRKNSSIVARLFLARPQFDSVQDALDNLRRRGGRVTLPTVSKVCKRLEQDLIIERERNGFTKLRLIQPEGLLERLSRNYEMPKVTKWSSGKLVDIDVFEFRRLIATWAKEAEERVTLTGASSVKSYAVMARGNAEVYYCSDVSGALHELGDRFQKTDRFASVTLCETRDFEVYFDRRPELIASPVQTYLELMAGDKRDQETAEQVRRVILNRLEVGETM